MVKKIGPTPICLLIHANLQYAEIPSSEIENIVKKSYLPTLDLFIENPGVKTVIDFSGYTLEILEKDYPKVIEKLRLLIKQRNVEILGSTYANPILPLIPIAHAKRQIISFQQIFNRLFGDLRIKPIGFFPQEYFFDASIVSLLNELGYKWIPVHVNQIINSLNGNLNNSLKKPFKNTEIPKDKVIKQKALYPFRIIGALGSSIAGFGTYDRITNLRVHQLHDKKISWAKYFKLLDELLVGVNGSQPFFFLGPSDMEFIGHFSFEGHNPISPTWLKNFCLKIASQKSFRFMTPREYLKKYPIAKQHYLKCGGDWASLELWTKDPDNERLNILCRDATNLLNQAENQLNIYQKFGFDTRKSKPVLQEGWKALMLAENADGRGWQPIAEKRLFCYNNAILAQKKAMEALESLEKTRI